MRKLSLTPPTCRLVGYWITPNCTGTFAYTSVHLSTSTHLQFLLALYDILPHLATYVTHTPSLPSNLHTIRSRPQLNPLLPLPLISHLHQHSFIRISPCLPWPFVLFICESGGVLGVTSTMTDTLYQARSLSLPNGDILGYYFTGLVCAISTSCIGGSFGHS